MIIVSKIFQNSILILTSLALSLLFSCGPKDPNEQIDEGKVTGNTYISNEIGWSIEIPEGWEVVEREESEAYTEKGMEMIRDEFIEEIDISKLKTLISFKKDQFNLFQSTSEPFELEYEGEYEDVNRELKVLLTDIYVKNGLTVDTSSFSITIGGLEFMGFHTDIYDPNGKLILQQDMYSRYINGFDFGVNINYNNEEDKKAMLEAWKNSSFQ